MANPLDLLYSWQGIMVAIAATGVTQLLKTVLDIVWGQVDPKSTPTVKDAARWGATMRRRSLIVNRLVLPMFPILVGFIMALIIPIHPDVLIQYVDTNHIEGFGRHMVFGAWGAACGQFASYTFDKVKDAFQTKSATS